ncbi:MAG TPA: hypothetical protein VGK48_19050 [Terriglobia bacterium]
MKDRIMDWLRSSRLLPRRKRRWHKNLTGEANAFFDGLPSLPSIDIRACRKSEKSQIASHLLEREWDRYWF